MKMFRVPKKSGGERTIYSPNYLEKTRLRIITFELNKITKRECDPDIVHGFIEGKSPVTNALKHVGITYTLSIDLKDFFDSVRPSMVEDFTKDFTYKELKLCFPNNGARQGLPTSPAFANLACIKLDKCLKSICEKGLNQKSPFQERIVYTRYADDLSFSSSYVEDLKKIRDKLPLILKSYGFDINQKKTRIQSLRYGRKNITGVSVGWDSIYPTRKTKNKLRALKHQDKMNKVRGLEEWMKLKVPSNKLKFSTVNKTMTEHLVRKFNNIPDKWKK